MTCDNCGGSFKPYKYYSHVNHCHQRQIGDASMTHSLLLDWSLCIYNCTHPIKHIIPPLLWALLLKPDWLTQPFYSSSCPQFYSIFQRLSYPRQYSHVIHYDRGNQLKSLSSFLSTSLSSFHLLRPTSSHFYGVDLYDLVLLFC